MAKQPTPQGIPALLPPPKTKVYRFGAAWHWKCKSPRCQRGGPAREWSAAIAKANDHTKSHAEEA